MATKTSRKRFKAWANSHSLHDPKTKLPFRLAVEMHEEMVDFIHGSLIGLLLGFFIGFILVNII